MSQFIYNLTRLFDLSEFYVFVVVILNVIQRRKTNMLTSITYGFDFKRTTREYNKLHGIKIK